MFRGGIRQLRVGGLLLLAAIVQFVVCEAVCASAWHSAAGDSGYDYAKNWISDLGAPGAPANFQGLLFVSPLHSLMNASFGILAGLGIVSGAMLTGLLKPSRQRLVARALFAIFSAGVALVALFPENVNYTWHNIGATATVTADALAIMFGLRGGHFGAPAWATRTSLALGSVGALVGLIFAFDLIDSAVVERIADYSPMAAFAVGGVAAIVARRTPAAPELVIDLVALERKPVVVDLAATADLELSA